jgi:hypothetical protein
VTTYIFTPKVLSLTSQSYPSHRFYSDTATFIRMSTPVLPLALLSKKKVVKPWASDIKEQIARFAEGEEGEIEPAEYNLKLLGCVFKRALSDATVSLHNLILQTKDQQQVSKALATFEDDVRTALIRLRKVGESTHKPNVPKRIRQASRAVDEYTALIAEEAITRVISVVEGLDPDSSLDGNLEALKDLAIDQYLYRRDNGYLSYAVDGEANEYLPHRWRVLKRFITSALYLEVSREKSGKIAYRIIAMVAAGAAMLFATLALLFIQEYWANSLSTAFVSLMVASYIIKDQIKDLGKNVVSRTIARFMPDHVVTFHGALGETLGSCEERFEVCNVDEIPNEVLDLRYSDLNSHEAIEGRPETVLCHTKNVTLHSAPLSRQFTGATGLTDVLRLNVQAMLERMDDTTERYQYIHPRTRQVMTTQCARIYRVNVILKLQSPDDSISLNRVRVVLDKSGIVRVEHVTNDPIHALPTILQPVTTILSPSLREQA